MPPFRLRLVDLTPTLAAMRTLRVVIVAVVAFVCGAALAPVSSLALSYFSITRTVIGTGTVSCPTGYRVVGGGADLVYGEVHTATLLNEFEIRSSRPSTSGWVATGRHIQGTYSSVGGWQYSYYPFRPQVYAICIH